MCYPKPGPRCSAHAATALRKAQETFSKEQTYENFQSLKEAQDEYDKTPRGLSALEERANDETIPSEERFAALDRFIHGKESRAKALKAIKHDDAGDVDVIDQVNGDKFIKRPAPGKTIPIPSDPQTPTTLTPPSISLYSPGLDFNDHRRHSDPDCHQSYCSDQVYVNPYLRVTDPEALTRSIFGDYSESHDTSDALPQAIADQFTSADYDGLEVDIYNGYYGEEAQISMSYNLEKKLTDSYYALPNAQDRDGALSYARSEGLTTAGKTPIQAIKELTTERALPQTVQKKVEMARTITKQEVSIAKIKANKKTLASTGAYDFTTRTSAGSTRKAKLAAAAADSKTAGILLANTDGTYTLVGGYERFNGLLSSRKNRARGTFLILK